MRVLLVEADHVVRDRVKVALQQFDGTTVDVAEDAWALELAKENAYDLVVISDHLDQAGDGLKILKELRAGGLAGAAVVLSRDRGEAATRDKEALNVAAVVAVPPDTVEIFKAIVTAQSRSSGKAPAR
jgi:DNA-binding NarL/FixJ family response regulator